MAKSSLNDMSIAALQSEIKRREKHANSLQKRREAREAPRGDRRRDRRTRRRARRGKGGRGLGTSRTFRTRWPMCSTRKKCRSPKRPTPSARTVTSPHRRTSARSSTRPLIRDAFQAGRSGLYTDEQERLQVFDEVHSQEDHQEEVADHQSRRRPGWSCVFGLGNAETAHVAEQPGEQKRADRAAPGEHKERPCPMPPVRTGGMLFYRALSKPGW